MRKRLISALMIAAAAFSAQSCLFEQNDIFEESASLRLAKTMEETDKVLKDSPNGWLFEIFPEGSQSYGGFALICKFNDDQTVDVYSELDDTPQTPVNSYYKMTNDNGPVLIFDTYNDNLHYFSTPSSSSYQAQQGEFEFVICEIQSDVIKVRGSKTGNIMYLRKFTEDPATYLNNVLAKNDGILLSGFKGNAGGKNITAEIDIENRQVDFFLDGELAETIAYAITPEGMRLYKPFEWEGGDITTMSIADDSSSVTVTGGSVSGTKFDAIFPKGYRLFTDYAGKYIFKYNAGEFPVELVPDADGVRYWMTGVTDYWDICLTYSKAKGTLSFTTQMLYDKSKNHEDYFMLDGKYMGLTAANPANATGTSAYLSYTFTHGMVTVWNEDEEHPVYKFVSNGLYSREVNTFWLNYYTGPTQTSATRTTANKAPEEYRPFKQTYCMFMVESLTKVD